MSGDIVELQWAVVILVLMVAALIASHYLLWCKVGRIEQTPIIREMDGNDLMRLSRVEDRVEDIERAMPERLSPPWIYTIGRVEKYHKVACECTVTSLKEDTRRIMLDNVQLIRALLCHFKLKPKRMKEQPAHMKLVKRK